MISKARGTTQLLSEVCESSHRSMFIRIMSSMLQLTYRLPRIMTLNMLRSKWLANHTSIMLILDKWKRNLSTWSNASVVKLSSWISMPPSFTKSTVLYSQACLLILLMIKTSLNHDRIMWVMNKREWKMLLISSWATNLKICKQ